MSTTTSNSSPLRVGILGCASIAKKNAIAIADPESTCCISAVASRSIEKARAFVEEMLPNSAKIVECYGSYDELIQSTKVDAVYIPLPTVLRKAWVLKAFQAKKHVLLEKPVGLCSEDYEEMIEAAKRSKVYLMDGTMFVHHPRTQKFVESVHDVNNFGTITRIESGFSFCGDEDFFQNNIRASSKGDPLGCLGDLGHYVVRMALLVAGPSVPMQSAQVVDFLATEDGVPIDATCLVKFENGIVLNFQCSFTSQFRQYVHVVGTKAYASMDDFVLPKEHPVNYQVQSMNLTKYDLITQHQVREEKFGGPVQEVLMWKNFARFVQTIAASGWDGKSEDCEEAVNLSKIAVRNQQILDAFMVSIHGAVKKVDAL